MHIPDFKAAEQLLDSFVPRPLDVKKVYNLDTVRVLADIVGNPQRRLRTIHVAGTSGKTSTCYYAAALLKEAGHTVGLTISPHLISVNERVQINGVPLNEREFCDDLGIFLDVVCKHDLRPTYFELMMVFALWEFDRKNVDFAVVEVGMGGTWDASNILERKDKICVITDIGIDHTRMLGNTVTEIARHKAGIIYKGNEVFMHAQAGEVMQVVEQRSHDVRATLHVLSGEHSCRTYSLPVFQQRNFTLALASVQALLALHNYLSVTPHQVARASAVQVPGRMELIAVAGKKIIMDGAHNPQKLDALRVSLEREYPEHSKIAIFGMLASKEGQLGMGLASVASWATSCIIVRSINNHQTVDVQAARVMLEAVGVESVVVKGVGDAVQEAMSRQEELIVVTGSLYLVADAKKALQKYL